MADGDWLKIAVQSGASLLSGAVGLLIGVWHAGKRSGKQESELEAKIRQDIEDRLRKAIDEMKTAFARDVDSRDLLIDQFQEAFSGLRRQMDDNKLHTEQNFVRKDDFRDFREEYREDIRDLKAMIMQNGKTHGGKP